MSRKSPGQSLLVCAAYLVLLSLILAPVAFANTSNLLSRADARHLLGRTGLGVDYRDLLHLTGKTREYAVDYILDGFSQRPAVSMPQWTHQPAPLYWTRQDLSPDDRLVFDRHRDAELIELRQWWIDNMLATQSPQTERMVLFWHNHFATSYHGINRQSKALAKQNQIFREHALGNFRTLLKLMIRDAALLNYLDNLSNRKDSPNENLARELLELFTLGEGNYDQHTVQQAARALTGHGISQNRDLTFEFKSWDHDTGNKTLFGVTANHNADDLVELILQQPAVATFIAKKFWHAFISDQPPLAESLTPLANAFRRSNYDLATLYRATLSSDDFWQPAARASMVKSPAHLILGIARALHFPKQHNQLIPALMARSGMNLFAPPNVAGWSGGQAWLTPGRMLNRHASIDDLLWTSGSANAEAATSGMMSSPMMMQPNNSNSEPTPSLQLHLAAENYHGAARYQVELRTAEKQLLWQAPDTSIAHGHETAKYGRINNISELPWQVVDVHAPDHLLQQAQLLRVHFTNDAGGDDGDRNLFVGGASIKDNWFDSSNGVQKSKCAPQSKHNSGRLYCNGFVDITIDHKDAATSSIQPLTASSVHVNWVRGQTDQLDLTLVLQDFYTAHDYFPTYSFHLKSRHEEPPRLELNTMGCWPNCLTHWPECAWEDKLNKARKTLAFEVDGPGDNQSLQCHADSINDAEKALISSLFNSAAQLTDQTLATHRDYTEDQRRALNRWQELLTKHEHSITRMHGHAPLVSIDAAVKRKTPAPGTPHRFNADLPSLSALERELNHQNVSFAELLLPGVPTDALPELHTLSHLSAGDQLNAIISHPVFQLH